MHTPLAIINIEPSKFVRFELNDGGVSLVFEKDQIILNDNHDQDCCEHVYADWETIDLYKNQLEGFFTKSIVITGVDNEGFLLSFEDGNDFPDKSIKIFIPCYNEQNGYYSSDLELIIEQKETKIKFDLSSFIEDRID